MVHDLKTWPEYFQQTWDGRKMFELRRNDRNYQTGDVLSLREYDPDTNDYTGRRMIALVDYILQGGVFGLPEYMCILSLRQAWKVTT